MKRLILLALSHFCIDASRGANAQVAQAPLQNTAPLPIAPLQQALPIQALHKLVLGYLDCWQETGQTFNMNQVTDIQFSPDGNFIACCSENKILLLRSRNNGTYQVHQMLEREWLQDDSMSHIQFSENGKYVIISSTKSRIISIWELRQDRFVFLQDVTNIDIVATSISFSLNGEFLAFSTKNNEKSEIRIYRRNNKNYEIVNTFIDEELHLLSPDATYLISKSQDNELKRHALYGQDFSKIKLLSNEKSVDQIGEGLLFSFNGTHIVELKEQLKIFYRTDDQQYAEVQRIPDKTIVLSLDGLYIATNSDDIINLESKSRKTLWHIWKLNQNKYEFVQTIEDITNGHFKSRIIFSPDNAYLVFIGYGAGKSIRIWELKNHLYQNMQLLYWDHDIQEIAFSRNNLYMACVLNNGAKNLIKIYGNQAKGAIMDDSANKTKSDLTQSSCTIL